jgi:SAM-dependent methyltransferase
VGQWQEIWQADGAKRLWSVPDPQVVELARSWKAAGDVRRVLDVGCGVGRHALCLAAEGLEVYGSDHSQEAVDEARRTLSDKGMTGVFWRGELEEIPYPDGFFDAAVAFNSIYHGTGDRVRDMVGRLRSKLRPSGRVFATLLSRNNRLYGKGECVGPDTFLTEGLFPGLFVDGGEKGVPHHFSDEGEVRRFFEGFRVQTLEHRELSLPSARREGGEGWFRIPGAFFWRITAQRE